MKKILFLILVLGIFLAAQPALAQTTGNSFLAAIIKMVQNIIPGMEKTAESADFPEEFVDPREVYQVLKEMNDMKKNLNSFAKQLKKMQNTENDINLINTLLERIKNFETNIRQEIDVRDNIQEFRDEQIWEEINKLRAKVEIPKETTQWNKEIKRIENLLKQKKYQSLGLNLDNVRTKIAELKSALAKIQEYYNSGDLENAMDEFNILREDFNPGELSSGMQRIWDIMNRLKIVKDEELKNQIKGAFAEAMTDFNEGEYRSARELLDESFNDISALIYKAYYIGRKKGYTKEGFLEALGKFQETITNRIEEKNLKIQEMAPQPVQEPKPAEPIPQPTVSFQTATGTAAATGTVE